MITAQVLSDWYPDGLPKPGSLLDRVDQEIGTVNADGAYDGTPTTNRSRTLATRWR